MPSDIAFLSAVAYAGKKREIFAEFSDGRGQFSRRFKFFPKLFVPKRFSAELLKDVLSVLSLQNFSVSQTEFSNRIEFSDFSGLEVAASVLGPSTGHAPIVLGPERQFLLERNWGFFGAFDPESLEALPPSFPEMRPPMFSGPVRETILELLEAGEGLAESVCSKMALSNFLRVPMERVPENPALQAELFVENALFSSGFAFERPPREKRFFGRNGFFPKFSCSELDFSTAWQAFFHKAFFNLGFETLDCECCVPKSHAEKNVLPNSMVETEFSANGFYFMPLSKGFAEKFHETAPFRESREKRMREFFLNGPEAGPFFFGQTVPVPLEDAGILEASGFAKINASRAAQTLHWFCLKRESFVGRELFNIQARASDARSKAKAHTGRHSTLGDFLRASSPENVFFESFAKSAAGVARAVPNYLARADSRFFSPALSGALLCLQETVLAKFEEFSSKSGERALCGGSKAFVRGSDGFFLGKDFSERQRLPVPAVRIVSGKNPNF